ncbi:MAG TPA: aminopeptidase, partial [Bdellovibrionota bacterium]|nr:aminopeptidase [Bdellovibrionota bacterium]
MMGMVSSGCSTMGYLLQAGKGQLALLNRAKPIEKVLESERVQPRIKRLLSEIPAIKKYGEGNGVKATHNYTEYVQLDRAAAVWVVSACEPLKFVSKEWSFPIVGRFPYLGWFDLDGARGLASELKKEGWDVDLRGARAFSTLGWFKDPVVSSMIPEGNEA